MVIKLKIVVKKCVLSNALLIQIFNNHANSMAHIYHNIVVKKDK